MSGSAGEEQAQDSRLSAPAKSLLLGTLLARDRVLSLNSKAFLKELVLRRDPRVTELLRRFEGSGGVDAGFLDSVHGLVAEEARVLFDELFVDTSLEVLYIPAGLCFRRLRPSAGGEDPLEDGAGGARAARGEESHLRRGGLPRLLPNPQEDPPPARQRLLRPRLGDGEGRLRGLPHPGLRPMRRSRAPRGAQRQVEDGPRALQPTLPRAAALRTASRGPLPQRLAGVARLVRWGRGLRQQHVLRRPPHADALAEGRAPPTGSHRRDVHQGTHLWAGQVRVAGAEAVQDELGVGCSHQTSSLSIASPATVFIQRRMGEDGRGVGPSALNTLPSDSADYDDAYESASGSDDLSDEDRSAHISGSEDERSPVTHTRW